MTAALPVAAVAPNKGGRLHSRSGLDLRRPAGRASCERCHCGSSSAASLPVLVVDGMTDRQSKRVYDKLVYVSKVKTAVSYASRPASTSVATSAATSAAVDRNGGAGAARRRCGERGVWCAARGRHDAQAVAAQS